MNEIFFFDVDGTLMNHHGFHIPDSTIETLKKLKEKGHILCIATGRSYDSLIRTPILSLIEWDGVICNNGQYVLDRNKEVLFEAVFPNETVRDFLKIAKEKNFPVVVKCDQRFISQPADQNTIDVHAYFNNPVPPVGDFNDQKVAAMNIYAPMDYDYQDFKRIEGISIIPCALAYGEVSVKGVNKASSIQYLLNHYHKKDYVAFGDSPNDIQMLKQAKCAIVMGQSNDNVKKVATFVTKPIDQNGIEYACKKYKWIGE